MSETNGIKKPTAWVRVEMDLLEQRCNITGEAPTLDCYINMLAQAQREFEAQLRMARAKEMQKAALDEAENKRLAALITKR